jgi:hypothetical protein
MFQRPLQENETAAWISPISPHRHPVLDEAVKVGVEGFGGMLDDYSMDKVNDAKKKIPGL